MKGKKAIILCCGANGRAVVYGIGGGIGYDSKVGRVNEHEAWLNVKWGVLRIGCEARLLTDWRERWHEVARQHEEEVSEALAEGLLARAEEMLAT